MFAIGLSETKCLQGKPGLKSETSNLIIINKIKYIIYQRIWRIRKKIGKGIKKSYVNESGANYDSNYAPVLVTEWV